MHRVTEEEVEVALTAFSKGNHTADATIESRMQVAITSVLETRENDRKRKELEDGAITAERIAAAAITWQAALSGTPTDAQITKALDKATAFYTGPMGLLYCVNNGYHDVAIRDLAKVLLQFHLSEKARKE